MQLVFDPAKDALNRDKHGLSLADAAKLDMVSAVIVLDDRKDYGEQRFRAFGRINGQAVCLVFAVTAGAVRAISFRRAHEKRMRRHERK